MCVCVCVLCVVCVCVYLSRQYAEVLSAKPLHFRALLLFYRRLVCVSVRLVCGAACRVSICTFVPAKQVN
jgi:hypothetical protein